MSNAQHAASKPFTSAPPPSSFFASLKNDTESSAFNDIQLESSDGELVPCSRLVLSMCSVVFADLLEFPEENVFPTPFPAWLLQEIRHVCYFGTFSFPDRQLVSSIDNDTIRKRCQLLVAMDYYQLDNALSEPLYNSLERKMVLIPGLACVTIDELGLDDKEERRPWIAKIVAKATHLLKEDPCKILRASTNKVGGVCSIQHANTIQQILSFLQTLTEKTEYVWVELEALYTWANSNPSYRAAAAELWEETYMLERLKADDPEYFTDKDDRTFDADSFGSSQDFAELRQYSRQRKNHSDAVASIIMVLFVICMVVVVLLVE